LAVGAGRTQWSPRGSKQQICGWETVRGKHWGIFARLVLVHSDPTSVLKDRKETNIHQHKNQGLFARDYGHLLPSTQMEI